MYVYECGTNLPIPACVQKCKERLQYWFIEQEVNYKIVTHKLICLLEEKFEKNDSSYKNSRRSRPKITNKSQQVDLYEKTYLRKFSRHQLTFFAIFVNLQKLSDTINRVVKS